MHIILPKHIERKLVKVLMEANKYEVGGILMGEYIKDGVYRIKNLTIQKYQGTYISFIRSPRGISTALRHFFYQTKHQYTRFNYLGEWHSHPSFSLEPSVRDCETMWDIVEDPKVGANFAILLTIQLNNIGKFEGKVTIYMPGHQMLKGELVLGRA